MRSTNISSTSIGKRGTGLVLRMGMAWMLVAAFAAGSPAAAQDSRATTGAPTTTAGFELDVLPYVSGGYYISGWIGHDRLRLRPVVAKTTLPSFVVQDGFTNADLEAYAVIVDYFPRGGLRGFWVGAGVEYWKNSIENESNGGTAKWDNTVATIGAGYVWKLGRNFYLNPWAAGHLVVGGETSVDAGGALYNPRRFTPEVSVKLGWHF